MADNEVAWRGPWFMLVTSSAVNLCLTPMMGVIEGCGLVKEVALVRLAQSVTGVILVWAALALKLGLYATFIPLAMGVAWGGGWLAWKMRRGLRDLLRARSTAARIDWWREVWPLQWKIALSWLSGYFIYQLVNPVLMRYDGPVEAGQMGMSLYLSNGLQVMGFAWVATKMPRMGGLVARREFVQLDRLFFASLGRAMTLSGLGGALCMDARIDPAQSSSPHRRSGAEPGSFGLLLLGGLMNLLIMAEACYLRAHKQEPFLWNSVAGAAVVGSLTVILGRFYGAAGVIVGTFAAGLVFFGWANCIFWSKRRDWHRLG